ncbi:hypothetical protein, partial [Streptomyces spororaveus]
RRFEEPSVAAAAAMVREASTRERIGRHHGRGAASCCWSGAAAWWSEPIREFRFPAGGLRVQDSAMAVATAMARKTVGCRCSLLERFWDDRPP